MHLCTCVECLWPKRAPDKIFTHTHKSKSKKSFLRKAHTVSHTQTPVTKYCRSPLPLDIYSLLIKSLTSWPWCSATGCVPLHTLHVTERTRARGNWHCHPVPPDSLSHSLITAGHCLCCPGNLWLAC